MSVRVVARIRPLLSHEPEKDVIVRSDEDDEHDTGTIVRIPNPKNEAEEFSFSFGSVYGPTATQELLFTMEVAPHIKALFQGIDLTIFAYGVTGTGKTHTMRGGLRLADRGVIPRLLSGIFRRGRKLARDSAGATNVAVTLSYYEIYNDRVNDLLVPPERRAAAGLPLRERDGKTHVVGLTERPCDDLKDFERLYIEANNHRVTAATKLNAHSSRSHAILRVNLLQTTTKTIDGQETREVLESTASAIDLAGSEDNRRADNSRERLVESAAINKSLFVLGQCIDAIARGERRIPYRESKMTRILSLGQNKGITVMILNLAPLRSYHLDTLSSLNVSSRAKRIEAREIENEVVFKQVPRGVGGIGAGTLAAIGARQPLRALTSNAAVTDIKSGDKPEGDQPAKLVRSFSVYTDKPRLARPLGGGTGDVRQPSGGAKSISTGGVRSTGLRPTKPSRPTLGNKAHTMPAISAEQIEAMVERKVGEILSQRAAAAAEPSLPPPTATQPDAISEAVQRRLDALERRIESEDNAKKADGRSDGLKLLLAAKQAREAGDDVRALELYETVLPIFPNETKLIVKIERLRARLAEREREAKVDTITNEVEGAKDESDGEYVPPKDDDEDEEAYKPKTARKPRLNSVRSKVTKVTAAEFSSFACSSPSSISSASTCTSNTSKYLTPVSSASTSVSSASTSVSSASTSVSSASTSLSCPPSPRTRQLLAIVNSRDPAQIRTLSGFGAKRAADLVGQLGLMGGGEEIESVAQLRAIPGFGGRIVDRAYEGLAA